jgi:hypothetical protein
MDPIIKKMLWYKCPSAGGKLIVPKCVLAECDF